MDPAMITQVAHAREMGIRLIDHGPGFARCVLPYRAELVGDPERGVLHGGAVTVLLDTMGGVAVVLAGVTPQATLDLRIDYLRPASPGRDLIGDVECYRTTRHVAFVRGSCHQGERDRPVAQMTATFMIADRPGLAPEAAG